MRHLYQGGLEDYVRRDINAKGLGTYFHRKNVKVTATADYTLTPRDGGEYKNTTKLLGSRMNAGTLFGSIPLNVAIPSGTTYSYPVWLACRKFGIYEVDVDLIGLNGSAASTGTHTVAFQSSSIWLNGNINVTVSFIDGNDIAAYINSYTPRRFLVRVTQLGLTDEEVTDVLYNSANGAMYLIVNGIIDTMTAWVVDKLVSGDRPTWSSAPENLTYMQAVKAAIDSKDANGPTATYHRFNDRGFFTLELTLPSVVGSVPRPAGIADSLVLQWCDLIMRDGPYYAPGQFPDNDVVDLAALDVAINQTWPQLT